MHRSISLLSPANFHFKSLRLFSTHQPFDEIPQRTPITSLSPAALAAAVKSSPGRRCGPQLHAFAVSSGLASVSPVRNSLINAYAKSGLFGLACKIFTGLANPDVVSWNTILSNFDSGPDALSFVSTMHLSGVRLDAVSFTVALSFSADMQELEFARQLHCVALKSGFGSDEFAGNSLITAYLRSSCVEEAQQVFDEKPRRDLVAWNALISGLTQEGRYGREAIEVFVAMVREEGVRLDHVSLASAISACGQEMRFDFGRQVHCLATRVGLEAHVSVANVLMSMYFKCESTGCAKKIFESMKGKNVVSWTTMISIDGDNAVRLFDGMRYDGVQPSDVTFVALISAVSADHSLQEAQMIHGICLKAGISSEVHVSNSLISMYAKLECTEESRKVFDEMGFKDVISWNSLIAGYAQNGDCEEALKAFSSLLEHCKPNQFTFGSILSAITAEQTVSLNYGRRFHCHITKLGLSMDEYVSGALIDMYSKHGSINESQMAFDETEHKSLINWTAIISAHSRHGNFQAMMGLFEAMVGSGVEPDHITFLAVLMACAGRGMVDAGRMVLDTMVLQYGLDPWPEHYNCMVDMLGRAGRLAEAEEMVRRIPKRLGLGLSAMQSLLGACTVHRDIKRGERVAEALKEMEPMEAGAYVLMSNLYAEKGQWESVARIRKEMRERGVKKEVGYSWVDVGAKDDASIHMHKFSSHDRSHPLAEEIYGVAECLGSDMKDLEEAAVLEN